MLSKDVKGYRQYWNYNDDMLVMIITSLASTAVEFYCAQDVAKKKKEAMMVEDLQYKEQSHPFCNMKTAKLSAPPHRLVSEVCSFSWTLSRNY